jgi:hypothetical protein
VFDAGLHPSAVVGHDMSVKLDRLAVGSILKQRNGLSDHCSIDTIANSYRPSPLHILLPGFAEDLVNERTMDGH